MTVKDFVVLKYTRAEIDAAQGREDQIKQDARDAADAFWRLSKHIQEFIETESWLPLGFKTFKEWAVDRGPKTYGYLRMHGEAWRLRRWLEERGEDDTVKELDVMGPEKVQVILPSLNVLHRREIGKPLKRDLTPDATPDPIHSATEMIRASIEAPQMAEVRAVAAQIVEGKHVANATVPVDFFTEKQRSELGMSDPKSNGKKIYLEWSYLED